MEIRRASREDFLQINSLYDEVYEGYYPLPETMNRKIFEWIVEEDLWLLALDGGKIIASLIFAGNEVNEICKCYGAAVKMEYSSRGIMTKLHSYGEELLKYPIYYALARMDSLAPQKILKKLGFVGLGIFPNAMRIKTLETHGLFACYKGDILNLRSEPTLIEPIRRIYALVRGILKLGNADIEPVRLKRRGESIDFYISTSKSVNWEYKDYKEQGILLFDFFPFYEPNMKFYTKNRSTEIFAYYNPKAAHIYITGMKTDEEILDVLESISDSALTLGCSYIEIVIPVNRLDAQIAAYNSDFLPSAYFPAFKKEGDKRVDCIVACRLLVPPSFKKILKEDMNRDFVKAYCDIYTEKMERDVYEWIYR